MLRSTALLVTLSVLLAWPARAEPSQKAAAPARATYLQASLGYLLPVPRHHRDDQGLDLGLGYGYRLRAWRLGGELRYTFLGGFDAPRPTYRVDVGFTPAYELFATRYVSMQLGGRFLFSRAGNYRRADLTVPGECGPEGCAAQPAEPRTVSFVAWYGFTAGLDLALFFPYCFVRVSGMHTSWFWNHERDAPRMEHWAHFALGYAH